MNDIAPATLKNDQPELSVVMPCLNEADTLGACIIKAKEAIRTNGISGEIVVADNGSTDESVEIALRHGARVVNVQRRGYGNALMAGIDGARGKYIIMGDGDDSYDFGDIPRFLNKLREGYDLVQGCRLPAGGGRVLPKAMPFLHRWLGNPMFTILVRLMFKAPIHDVNCGMRGFKKESYLKLGQRCTGMEFAVEMVIKSSLNKYKISEVPIILHPDGRKSHAPHLKTFRDGWRTLRFYFLSSPRWLFLMPGILAMLAGIVGYAVAMPGLKFFGATFDAHTLLFATLFILIGHQSICFALFAKVFACREGLLPYDTRLDGFFKFFTLEKGLIGSIIAILAGLGLLLAAINIWRLRSFGALEYAHTMRVVIPGVMLTALGVQTILSSLIISVMSLTRN